MKVVDHRLCMQLPQGFDYTDVEVIVIPRDNDMIMTWSEEELTNIGKMGFNSKSFVDDEEDYTKW